MQKFEPHINPETYTLIDNISGEPVPLNLFIKEIEKNQWEKAYAHLLADYIEAPGDKSCKVLAYLIRNKNRDNMVLGTHRGLADSIGVGHATVTKILKILQVKKLIKKIRNGCYMVDPKMLGYGSHNAQVALMVMWEKK